MSGSYMAGFMTSTILPWVRPDDFERLQRVVPELQNMNFAEWQDEHNRAVDYCRRRNGSTLIPVTADAFTQWLSVTGQLAHVDLILIYARKVAGFAAFDMPSIPVPQHLRNMPTPALADA